MNTEKITDRLSLTGSTASIIYSLLLGEAEFMTVGLGALVIPATLRFTVQAKSTKVILEKAG